MVFSPFYKERHTEDVLFFPSYLLWERKIPHLTEQQTKMEILLLRITKIVLWEMETNETTQHQIHIVEKRNGKTHCQQGCLNFFF